MSDYYTLQAKSLLAEFDKTVSRVKRVFIAHFGPKLTETLIQEARQEYRELIPQLPDIGGKQPFTQFVISSGWFLAMYRVLKRHNRTLEEAGQLIYEVSEAFLKAYPRFLRRLLAYMNFSSRYLRSLQKRAAESQLRRYEGDYVFTFVKGDGQTFDYGVDYTECAACKFYQQQGAMELAPYLCPVDKLYSEILSWGLTRTTTLAEGYDRCDFRFKKGGPTRVAVPRTLST